MKIDPHFHQFIGKTLIDVSDQLKVECSKHGYLLAVQDPTSPRNIDVEPKRLTVHVDSEFKIERISLG